MQNYFQTEMHYFHEAAQAYADNHPEQAGRLNLRELRDKDPHVERLLEGVAFLTAQIRQRIEADLPDLTATLLSLFAPDSLRPYPSMTIMQFVAQAGILQKSLSLPKNTEVFSEPVGEEAVSCRFSTTAELVIHPLEIAALQVTEPNNGGSLFRIHFKTLGSVNCKELSLPNLGLYIQADPIIALQLYWMLVGQTQLARVHFDKNDEETLTMMGRQEVITSGNLEDYAGLLPDNGQVGANLQLLKDYFHFRERYFFVNIQGLEKIAWPEQCQEFVIEIHTLAVLPQGLNLQKQMLQLNCVPAVNLYQQASEPILYDQQSHEYQLNPDLARPESVVLYNVDEVIAIQRHSNIHLLLQPLTSFKHKKTNEGFYQVHNRSGGGQFPLNYLAVGGMPSVSPHTLSCKLTVCNGHYPRRYLHENSLNQLATTAPRFLLVKNIMRPSPCWPQPDRKHYQWQVIAYLALNLSSMNNVENLRQLLQLQDCTARADNARRIAAIRHIEIQGIDKIYRGALSRGVEITITLNEEGFSCQADVFLFGQVMSKFFTSYIAINSFVQLRIICQPSQREFLWEPQLGMKPPL